MRQLLFHSDYADLSQIASENNLSYHFIKSINAPKTVELIKSLEPDLLLVFGWSQIVSKEVLGLPRFGCIGTHLALLSRNRGRHPIVWALVEGLKATGVTFFTSMRESTVVTSSGSNHALSRLKTTLNLFTKR